ncbi:hypothetical protein [Legionella erythra]|uniref:Uncharacterized protein n=1 Tax=Legionella erythra TaxID=448 RepID=A0A0W0TGL9_LEGER|nr:hypothetical protein [Legionella erythra]KTC94718.1 hypothetical protein Lery_2885 [Legionella erythra]
MQSKSEYNLSSLSFKTKSKRDIIVDATDEATKRFGTHFLERIYTPKGLATVIGVYKDNLWVWLDIDPGPSYWDNITSSIFDYPGFTKSDDVNFPDELKKYLPPKLDFFNLLANIDNYSSDTLGLLLREELNKSPRLMAQQLALLFQEFEKLSAADIEILAEEEALDEKGFKAATDYPSITAFDKLSKDFNVILEGFQSQLALLTQQMKNLDEEKAPQLYGFLAGKKLQLEQICKESQQIAQKLPIISTESAHYKDINRFLRFNRLLAAILDVFYDYSMDSKTPDQIDAYVDGSIQLAQFLYAHGQQFLEDNPIKANDKNKQELSESLNALETTLLFLLLSGSRLPAAQAGAIYFRLLDEINSSKGKLEIPPSSFNLAHFSQQNPQDFIRLYQRFFLTAGPFKQKIDELLNKANPILLTEVGKLAVYYARAKERMVNSHSRPGEGLEIKYYLQMGVSYLLRALRSGHPLITCEIDAILSTDSEMPCSTAMATELARSFSETNQLKKARSYLRLALKSHQSNPKDTGDDKTSAEQMTHRLELLEIKLDILEKTGDEQQYAINTLIKRAKQQDKEAEILYCQLQLTVPAVALAAIFQWKAGTGILSLGIIKLAEKIDPAVAAWSLNQYNIRILDKKPDLGLVSQAVLANFEPAIIELNDLLNSSHVFTSSDKDIISSVLSTADIWQHIDPPNLVKLILKTRGSDILLEDDLNKFMCSMAHAALPDSQKHFKFLAIILKDLRNLLDTPGLITFLYAIKRTQISIKTDIELPAAIAAHLIQRCLHSDNDKALIHSFMDQFLTVYPAFGLDLREDAKALEIIQQSDQLTLLLNQISCDSEKKMEQITGTSQSALVSLSLFNPANDTGSTAPIPSPMEMHSM